MSYAIQFAIPLEYNDKTPVPERLFERLERFMLRSIGFFNVGGPITGPWLMPDGTLQVDTLRTYTLVVDELDKPLLLRCRATLARVFKQDAIYCVGWPVDNFIGA